MTGCDWAKSMTKRGPKVISSIVQDYSTMRSLERLVGGLALCSVGVLVGVALAALPVLLVLARGSVGVPGTVDEVVLPLTADRAVREVVVAAVLQLVWAVPLLVRATDGLVELGAELLVGELLLDLGVLVCLMRRLPLPVRLASSRRAGGAPRELVAAMGRPLLARAVG